VGALSHLGIPIYGFILPLIVWAVSEKKPFRRAHSRQALSFQCVFLVPYVICIGLMAFGKLNALVPVTLLAVGFVLEIPQVRRALAGRPPRRLIPVEVLP
jgi:uncharacterized Tic20 family protein